MTKALAYQMALIPSVIYATKFQKSPHSKTNPNVPQSNAKSSALFSELLYISNTFGGLQFTDVTMQVQKLKHRMVRIALSSISSASHAVQAMISRCYRQSVSDPSLPLKYSTYQKNWITSYIEQQDINGLNLLSTFSLSTDLIINSYSTTENINLVDWIAA